MKTKILISPGYGAGFSTWAVSLNKTQKLQLITNLELINIIERKVDYYDDFEKILTKLFPKEMENHNIYIPGNIEVVEIDNNRVFMIKEYDGHESISYIDENSNVYLIDKMEK